MILFATHYVQYKALWTREGHRRLSPAGRGETFRTAQQPGSWGDWILLSAQAQQPEHEIALKKGALECCVTFPSPCCSSRPAGAGVLSQGPDSQAVVTRFNNSDNRGVGIFFPSRETFQFIELFN